MYAYNIDTVYSLLWKKCKISRELIGGNGGYWSTRQLYYADGSQGTYALNTEYLCENIQFFNGISGYYSKGTWDSTSPGIDILFYN